MDKNMDFWHIIFKERTPRAAVIFFVTKAQIIDLKDLTIDRSLGPA